MMMLSIFVMRNINSHAQTYNIKPLVLKEIKDKLTINVCLYMFTQPWAESGSGNVSMCVWHPSKLLYGGIKWIKVNSTKCYVITNTCEQLFRNFKNSKITPKNANNVLVMWPPTGFLIGQKSLTGHCDSNT